MFSLIGSARTGGSCSTQPRTAPWLAHRRGRSLRFPKAELHERAGRLAQERKDTARLLDSIAREEHVRLDHALSTPRVTRRMLGLPQEVRACVFDLEGVLAGSSRLHAAAWAETLDEFLSRRVETMGERFAPYRPFDQGVEYERYIQGMPRLQGVHAFLASRGIRLPEEAPPIGPVPKPSGGSRHARTRPCYGVSIAKASPRSRAHASISRERMKRAWPAPLSRPARTQRRSCSEPDSPT